MGVNWNERMMRWMPHVDDAGRVYTLTHLHPFRYVLPVNDNVSVEIRVTFALHCFTRACAEGDTPSAFYRDDRETRTFCVDRYALSQHLPAIARTLTTRKCGFAKNENYVTIDLRITEQWTTRYGVFFNVRRVKDVDGLAMLLTIQSAYELAPNKQLPIRGAIKFHRLIELILGGTKPRPPRN